MRIRLMAALLMAPLALAGVARAADCSVGPATAAATNAVSYDTLDWAPFRRPERGWAIYGVRIAAEIATRCAADTPGFAAALARWQAAHALPGSGIVDAPGFAVMNAGWTAARPFVAATRDGDCPLPPAASALAPAGAGENYGGKAIVLRRDALAAYRRLRAAARREIAVTDPDWLRLFSGYRAPVDDDLRCATEGNCDGIVRATCSAHRTGLALDLHVGHAPGFGLDQSDDANRRAMVRTLAYRWLVTNAARFGFANYAFEPWHWEYGPAPYAPSTRPRAPGKTPA
jgi:D-alanyl-D-alanine carboxypeptidase